MTENAPLESDGKPDGQPVFPVLSPLLCLCLCSSGMAGCGDSLDSGVGVRVDSLGAGGFCEGAVGEFVCRDFGVSLPPGGLLPPGEEFPCPPPNAFTTDCQGRQTPESNTRQILWFRAGDLSGLTMILSVLKSKLEEYRQSPQRDLALGIIERALQGIPEGILEGGPIPYDEEGPEDQPYNQPLAVYRDRFEALRHLSVPSGDNAALLASALRVVDLGRPDMILEPASDPDCIEGDGQGEGVVAECEGEGTDLEPPIMTEQAIAALDDLINCVPNLKPPSFPGSGAP